MQYPVTPDGRYFEVRGRLWRCTNPNLPVEHRAALTRELMKARRDKGVAIRANDAQSRQAARRRIDNVKVLLGERGPVWWSDGAPDYNRHLTRNSPYAGWAKGRVASLEERAMGERREMPIDSTH